MQYAVPPPSVITGGSPSPDFNGDGFADYADQWRDTNQFWIHNNVGGSFGAGSEPYQPSLPSSGFAQLGARFVGSAPADYADIHVDSRQAWIHARLADGSFDPPGTSSGYALMTGGVTVDKSSSSVEFFAADFDGDGKSDFAKRELATGLLWVYLNNGQTPAGFGGPVAGKFVARTAVGPNWRVLVGDFTGDGKADYADQSLASGAIYIHKNTGAPAFAMDTVNWRVLDQVNAGADWMTIVGDFTGDGWCDYADVYLPFGMFWVHKNLNAAPPAPLVNGGFRPQGLDDGFADAEQPARVGGGSSTPASRADVTQHRGSHGIGGSVVMTMTQGHEPPVRNGSTIPVGLAIVGVLLLIVNSAWLSDDAYITLRVVDNLWHGYGLRWNAIERVQVYTHPLWMLLLAACYGMTREAYWTTIGVSLALSATVVVALARRLAPSAAAALATLGLALASKAFVEFSTSGLENPLSHVLIHRLLPGAVGRSRRRPRPVIAALLAGLSGVCGLDLLALTGPPLIAAVWARREETGRAGAARLALVAAAPLLAWSAFAFFYYGTVVPNTALAKLPPNIGLLERIRGHCAILADAAAVDPVTVATIGATAAWAWR